MLPCCLAVTDEDEVSGFGCWLMGCQRYEGELAFVWRLGVYDLDAVGEALEV